MASKPFGAQAHKSRNVPVYSPEHTPVHSPIVEELDSETDDGDEYDDPPEEEIIEEERPKTAPPTTSASSSSPSNANARTGEPRVQTHFHDRGKEPAYVAPIPKIGRIPSLNSIRSPKDTPSTPPPASTTVPPPPEGISSYGRPTLPRFLTARLVGKTIDEYGDVCEGDDVLGRVAGDLPDMVGRAVSNENGDVLGDDGELLGYVEHVTTDAERRSMQEARRRREAAAAAQPLDEFTGGGSSAFRVDADGNILDGQGNVVGKMHDKAKTDEKGQKAVPGPPPVNAESHRKEGESPSDIFLDVKSTTEGIQLTIRIPTVFPNTGQPPKMPNISFT